MTRKIHSNNAWKWIFPLFLLGAACNPGSRELKGELESLKKERDSLWNRYNEMQGIKYKEGQPYPNAYFRDAYHESGYN